MNLVDAAQIASENIFVPNLKDKSDLGADERITRGLVVDEVWRQRDR